jgi:hypothetical protein
MLINKQPDTDTDVRLDLSGFAAASGTLYRYSEADPHTIVSDEVDAAAGSLTVSLPAYSITLVDLTAG